MGYLWEEAEHDSVVHALKDYFLRRNMNHTICINPSYKDTSYGFSQGGALLYPDLVAVDKTRKILFFLEVTVPSGFGDFLSKSISKWKAFSSLSNEFVLVVPRGYTLQAKNIIDQSYISIKDFFEYEVDETKNTFLVRFSNGNIITGDKIRIFKKEIITCDINISQVKARSERLSALV
jgi:hypothetical protein